AAAISLGVSLARPAPAPYGIAKTNTDWLLQKVRKFLDTTRESRRGKPPLPFRMGWAGVSDGRLGQCPQRFPVVADIFYTLFIP
ncbi:MAG: hypothetical protein LBM00_08665, partial [Deltaproteobacteria bacterium]|nr:hypothetical protein [Deltaproteobacteria bacterium]